MPPTLPLLLVTSVTEVKRRKVGVLGGTFDPPHIGHLLAAVSARHQLDLAETLIVPAGDPWQKTDSRKVSPGPTRLSMAKAAAEPYPFLVVDDLEVRRSGPSYTIDTVEQLKRDSDVEIVLILGSDAYRLLDTWHRYEELLGLVELAVISRRTEGLDHPELDLAATRWPAKTVEMPRLDISSSEIRSAVATGISIDVIVPPAVVEIIDRLGLYR